MRFRGVKVILRDGLEVTDQVRKDMFYAWQDLQLLHATQPGLHYKYMIGGHKSWKVSSLNGVDKIELLGYLAEKEVPEPSIKLMQWTQQFIWPAFEVTDVSGNYVGIVLCKGGGFNPPYEFVNKVIADEPIAVGDWGSRTMLPYDWPYKSLIRPKERNWSVPATDYYTIRRSFEDIRPLGRARAYIASPNDRPYINDSSEDVITQASSCVHDSWIHDNDPMCYEQADYEESVFVSSYAVKCIALIERNQTESLIGEGAISFGYTGEESPGVWPTYTYYTADDVEVTYSVVKPLRLLNIDIEAYYNQTGSGNALAYGGSITECESLNILDAVGDSPFGGLYWWVGCWRTLEDFDITDYETAAKNCFDSYYNFDPYPNTGPLWIKDMHGLTPSAIISGEYNYEQHIRWPKIDWFWGAAIYDEDRFAFICRNSCVDDVRSWVIDIEDPWMCNPPSGCEQQIASHTNTEDKEDWWDNIFVALCQDTYIVKENHSKLNPIADEFVKYFDLNTDDITAAKYGLYYIVTKEDEVFFVFGSSSNGKVEFTTTELSPFTPLEGVTGPNELPLYADGTLDAEGYGIVNSWNLFRLIKETTIKMKECV